MEKSVTSKSEFILNPRDRSYSVDLNYQGLCLTPLLGPLTDSGSHPDPNAVARPGRPHLGLTG
jgi:hypothetical protein